MAAEEGVAFGAYKIGAPSPYLPCGTPEKPCEGFWMFGFSNFAREGSWDIVLVLVGEKAAAQRTARRIRELLESPPPPEETARLGQIWLAKARGRS